MYDPFAGTGSMLYALAHWGAYVFGSDIDGRQMRGKRKCLLSFGADFQSAARMSFQVSSGRPNSTASETSSWTCSPSMSRRTLCAEVAGWMLSSQIHHVRAVTENRRIKTAC